MDALRAALFDWRGTLAHSAPAEWWARRAFGAIGRAPEAGELAAAAAAIEDAGAMPGIDASATLHREASLRTFARAGLDGTLADAIYRLDGDAANHPFYPDAEPVLRALRARGVAIAVVSDIHLDLRPVFAAHGVAGLVDAWALSYELGFQKPDPRMFTVALEALGVSARHALMVGDRASHDGGAADAGIVTLILPPPPDRLRARGLEVVLDMAP